MVRHNCFLCLLIGFVSVAQATTWTVDSNLDTSLPMAANCAAGAANACRLRDAIAAATGGDTIIFNLPVGSTMIELDHGELTFVNLAGTITVDGANISGASQVAVDGIQSTRIFVINQEASVDIRNLTIQNGLAASSSGGGIANSGTLTLKNCTIVGNRANYDGGGISNSGTLTVRSSTLSNNTAVRDGGSINNTATLSVNDSILSGNDARYGGAISNKWSATSSGFVTVKLSTLANNTAVSGGAIYNSNISNYYTLAISDSTLSGNTASDLGGGVFNVDSMTFDGCTFSINSADSGGGIYSTDKIVVNNSAFLSNSADSGGGVYSAGIAILRESTLDENVATSGGGINNSGALSLIRSTLSNNTATSNGGGIYSAEPDDDSVMLIDITLSGNDALNGGGIYYDGQSGSSKAVIVISSTIFDNHASQLGGGLYTNSNDVTFFNSIIADGCSGSGAGHIGDNGGNLDAGNSCGFLANTSLSNAVLKLGPLQNNGGPTRTVLPASGSDAINFTVCTYAPPYDQRGAARPDAVGHALATPCDSGAIEVGSMPSVGIFANGFGRPPFYD